MFERRLVAMVGYLFCIGGALAPNHAYSATFWFAGAIFIAAAVER